MRQQRPYMLIGSPMRTASRTWQRLNEAKTSDLDALLRAKRQAIKHTEFMITLYHEQLGVGRYFLHMKAFMAIPGVELASGDQRQYG